MYGCWYVYRLIGTCVPKRQKEASHSVCVYLREIEEAMVGRCVHVWNNLQDLKKDLEAERLDLSLSNTHFHSTYLPTYLTLLIQVWEKDWAKCRKGNRCARNCARKNKDFLVLLSTALLNNTTTICCWRCCWWLRCNIKEVSKWNLEKIASLKIISDSLRQNNFFFRHSSTHRSILSRRKWNWIQKTCSKIIKEQPNHWWTKKLIIYN